MEVEVTMVKKSVSAELRGEGSEDNAVLWLEASLSIKETDFMCQCAFDKNDMYLK